MDVICSNSSHSEEESPEVGLLYEYTGGPGETQCYRPDDGDVCVWGCIWDRHRPQLE